MHRSQLLEVAASPGQDGVRRCDQSRTKEKTVSEAAPIGEDHRSEVVPNGRPPKARQVRQYILPTETAMCAVAPGGDLTTVSQVGHVLTRGTQERRGLSRSYDCLIHRLILPHKRYIHHVRGGAIWPKQRHNAVKTEAQPGGMG